MDTTWTTTHPGRTADTDGVKADTEIGDLAATDAGTVALVVLEATAAGTAAVMVTMAVVTVDTDAGMEAMVADTETTGAGIAWVLPVAMADSTRVVSNTIPRPSAKRVAFRTALPSRQYRSKVVFRRYRVWSLTLPQVSFRLPRHTELFKKLNRFGRLNRVRAKTHTPLAISIQ